MLRKVALSGLLAGLSACTSGIRPVSFGKDDCSFCKMTVMDKHFAAEILTKKGKVYILDDLSCARRFLESGGLQVSEVRDIYGCNFNGQGELLSLRESFLVHSDALTGPMQGHEAVFATAQEAEDYIQKNGGKIVPSSSFPGLK